MNTFLVMSLLPLLPIAIVTYPRRTWIPEPPSMSLEPRHRWLSNIMTHVQAGAGVGALREPFHNFPLAPPVLHSSVRRPQLLYMWTPVQPAHPEDGGSTYLPNDGDTAHIHGVERPKSRINISTEPVWTPGASKCIFLSRVILMIRLCE
jgi:hypothetical protein